MGAVGVAALLAAKSVGVRHVIAVDAVDAKLEIATTLGADHTINTREVKGLATSIRDIFPDGVNHILDTTGLEVLLQESLKALTHEGTLALVGVPLARPVIKSVLWIYYSLARGSLVWLKEERIRRQYVFCLLSPLCCT
jgi:Zn-dependent alcohol dehydrogenase